MKMHAVRCATIRFLKLDTNSSKLSTVKILVTRDSKERRKKYKLNIVNFQ